MKVISCSFDNCYAEDDYGGGIATEHLANVYIYSTLFSKCHGRNKSDPNSGGGAVFLNDTKQCHEIHDCDFIQCESGADGGAVHLRNSKNVRTDGIANTRFVGCKTLYEVGGAEGGALQFADCPITCQFSDCLIAQCHSCTGGGFFVGVYGNPSANIILFSFFSANSATGTAQDVYFYNTPTKPFLHCFYSRNDNKNNRVYPDSCNSWLPQGVIVLDPERTGTNSAHICFYL